MFVVYIVVGGVGVGVMIYSSVCVCVCVVCVYKWCVWCGVYI